MMWIWISYSLAIAVIMSLTLSAPLWKRSKPYLPPADDQSAFETGRIALDTLSDLRSAHLAGKISDADFTAESMQIERTYLHWKEETTTANTAPSTESN